MSRRRTAAKRSKWPISAAAATWMGRSNKQRYAECARTAGRSGRGEFGRAAERRHNLSSSSERRAPSRLGPERAALSKRAAFVGLRERWVTKRRLVRLCCATAAYAAAVGRPSSSARPREHSSRTAWAAAHRSQSATAARASARACWPKACSSATAPPPPRLLICMRPASSSSSSSARSCAWCAQGDARCNPGGPRLQPGRPEAATRRARGCNPMCS